MADASSIRYETKKPAPSPEKKPEMRLQVHFRPLGTRIVVQPITQGGEQVTSSGIIIPDVSGGEKPQEGWILALGEDVNKKITVGDRVLFSRYAGDEIRIRDEAGIEQELKILHYEALLGVVDLAHDKPKNSPAVSKAEVRSDKARRHGQGSRKGGKKKGS